jgi:hypothetical protein
MAIYQSGPLARHEPSLFLRLNLISIWKLASEAIFKGKSLRVEQASHYESETNRVPSQVGDSFCFVVSVNSLNLASDDYLLVRKSVAAFALFQR